MLRRYILGLEHKVFVKKAVQMKNALSNKFYAVYELVDAGYYEDAYLKTHNDIRSKIGLESGWGWSSANVDVFLKNGWS